MKKSFDAVAWMRRRREEIDEEDNELSWAQKKEKTKKLLENDPLWKKLKDRLVEPISTPVRAVREKQEEYDQKKPTG